MAHLDLFSGIGGFALAAKWAGYDTIGFCEIDPYCQRVLRRHWPDVPIWNDVRDFEPQSVGVELLTAGFPCQDVSQIGLRVGVDGERSSLFSHAIRIAGDIRPEWVLLENTSGLRHRGFGAVLGALAEIGYGAVWDSVPASAVGAPHQRERVWIIANAKPERLERFVENWTEARATLGEVRWAENESEVLGMDDGFPGWMDQVKGLGNAIVPQVAYQIITTMEAG